MVSLIAPPTLFSAYAVANWGQLGAPLDADLPKGTHVRVYAGFGASFPVTPFLCFRVRSQPWDLLDSTIVARDGTSVPAIDPRAFGPLEMICRVEEERGWTVRLDVHFDDWTDVDVSLLDQHNRLIARRNDGPWLFAAPKLHGLFFAGDAARGSVSPRVVTLEQAMQLEPGTFAGALGLPVTGDHPWYLGMHTRDDAIQRVMDGAPLRLTPMDRPARPFDPVTPDGERARVEELLAASQFGGGLEKLVAAMVDQAADPPWRQSDQQDLPAASPAQQYATVDRLASLQMAATDPGLARFFGYARRFDDQPDLEHGEDWDTLAIVALFALDPRAIGRAMPDLSDLAQAPANGAAQMVGLVAQTIGSVTGEDPASIAAQIQRLTDRASANGLVIAPFVTFAAPVPPSLPPDLPAPVAFDSQWEQATGGTPSQTYRTSFAFPSPPLMSLSALARDDGSGLRTRHDVLPGGRAVPGVFGSAKLTLTPGLAASAAILADHGIPANPAAVTFQASAGDCFGRFGQPVTFIAGPPPRPAPPPPVLRYQLDFPPAIPAGDGPVSPGSLAVTVAVPQPGAGNRFTGADRYRLGSAIVVPRIDDLAAGARPLATLQLTLAGETRSVPVTAPGLAGYTFALPALAPQASAEWTLSGSFRDSAGVPSGVATVLVPVTDRRPPKVYQSGIGVYWSAAPGPSPDVEVRLQWPANAGSKHRVYLTDAQAIGVATADGAGERSRGLIGALGCQRIRDGGQVDRARFSLLTDPPVEAGSDGLAVLNARLPRALSTVQFLRVVPIGPDGAEPDFNACGIVPVAVPEWRRPVAPQLAGTIDPATGNATLTITTDGLSKDALQRDEPGLFDSSQPGAAPPQFRLRRSRSAVADPIYAPVVGTGALALSGTDGNVVTFANTWPDKDHPLALRPFVRSVFWAEVRYPPERRLPAGWIPDEPAGGVTTTAPEGREPHPRPYSLPSAPCVLMWAPPDAPAAPLAADITLTRQMVGTDIRLSLQIANPPAADGAVDVYRLAAWTQLGDGPIERVTEWNGAPPSDEWPPLTAAPQTLTLHPAAGADPAAPITVRLAYVDPVGRLGQLTPIEVPA